MSSEVKMTVWEAMRWGGLDDVKEYFEESGLSVNIRAENYQRNGHPVRYLGQYLRRTPLHEAVFWADSDYKIEVLTYLLGRGADANLQDAKGDSPLHLAAQYAMAEAAEILIDARANPYLRNNAGMNPVQIAFGLRTSGGYSEDTLQKIERVFQRAIAIQGGARPHKIFPQREALSRESRIRKEHEALLQAPEGMNRVVQDLERKIREESQQGRSTDDWRFQLQVAQRDRRMAEQALDRAAARYGAAQEEASRPASAARRSVWRGLNAVRVAETTYVNGVQRSSLIGSAVRESEKPKRYIAVQVGGSAAGPAWEKVYDLATKQWIDGRQQRELSQRYNLVLVTWNRARQAYVDPETGDTI